MIFFLKFLIEETDILITGFICDGGDGQSRCSQHRGGELELLLLNKLDICVTSVFLQKDRDIIWADMEKFGYFFLRAGSKIILNIADHGNNRHQSGGVTVFGQVILVNFDKFCIDKVK